ncbi:hypothetical protein HDU98_006893 [Podochytrium sp. JEL0797]|nr:hypothetical protein HDU98_006893 [Podochytrium sp. JEL0797]
MQTLETAADAAQAIRDLESSPGLGRAKERALHMLLRFVDSLSSPDIAAVKRTSTNPAEHPYIRGAAFVILAYVDTTAAILVKRCKQALSAFTSMSPAQLEEKVCYLFSDL